VELSRRHYRPPGLRPPFASYQALMTRPDSWPTAKTEERASAARPRTTRGGSLRLRPRQLRVRSCLELHLRALISSFLVPFASSPPPCLSTSSPLRILVSAPSRSPQRSLDTALRDHMRTHAPAHPLPCHHGMPRPCRRLIPVWSGRTTRGAPRGLAGLVLGR
jgi:hypothetical protein